MNDPFRSTAYLVAHAYTDPNARMLPQIHAVRIYSEGATSLSYIGKDQTALDVYNYRGRSYQEASDHLCYIVQTLFNLTYGEYKVPVNNQGPIVGNVSHVYWFTDTLPSDSF